jgi:hypothetical protein
VSTDRVFLLAKKQKERATSDRGFTGEGFKPKASSQRLHDTKCDVRIEIQDKKGSNLFMKDLKAAGR